MEDAILNKYLHGPSTKKGLIGSIITIITWSIFIILILSVILVVSLGIVMTLLLTLFLFALSFGLFQQYRYLKGHVESKKVIGIFSIFSLFFIGGILILLDDYNKDPSYIKPELW